MFRLYYYKIYFILASLYAYILLIITILNLNYNKAKK